MNKKLLSLKNTWDRLAQKNPILYIYKKDIPLDEFFKTGVNEINKYINEARNLNVKLSFKRALDFGCGIGRLTQALALYFEEVYGVDISSKMIELAIKYNYNRNIKFIVNNRDDLKIFPDNYFDFIVSVLTLQHIKPEISLKYIEELYRVLAPNGLLIFQLPSEPSRSLGGILIKILPQRLLKMLRGYEMYSIKKDLIICKLNHINAKILKVEEDNRAGPNWKSYTYFVSK